MIGLPVLVSFFGGARLADGVRRVGVSVFVTIRIAECLNIVFFVLCLFFNGCLVPVSFAFYNVYTSGLSTQ